MCLNIGTPKTINFPFVPNGKFMVLGVPILKHKRVILQTVLNSDWYIPKIVYWDQIEFISFVG